MESAAERKSIYQELLTESFEHLAKQLPKTSKAAVQQLLGNDLFNSSLQTLHDIHHHIFNFHISLIQTSNRAT